MSMLCHAKCAFKPAFSRSFGRLSLRRSVPQVCVRATREGEDLDALKADLERFKQKSGGPSAASSSTSTLTSSSSNSSTQAEQPSALDSVKGAVEKVLIANFFVILFSLGWLGVGVVLATASGTGSSPVLDAWYPLWPTLWQSSIGLLMAGALVSGGLGWLSKQQQNKQ